MTIQFKNTSVFYHRKTPFEYQALKDINTTFDAGKFYGLIGHTGSGKSTLIQTMNGLLLPSAGTVEVDGIQLTKKGETESDSSCQNESGHGISVS